MCVCVYVRVCVHVCVCVCVSDYALQPSVSFQGGAVVALYPSLDDYMGLNLSPEVVEQHMQLVPSQVRAPRGVLTSGLKTGLSVPYMCISSNQLQAA